MEAGGPDRPGDEWSRLSDDLAEAERGHSWKRLLFGRRLADQPTRQTVLGAVVGLGGLASGVALLPVAWPLGVAVMAGSQVIAFRIYRQDAHSTTQSNGSPDYEAPPGGNS